MDCEDNVISSANMSLTPSSTVVRQLNKLSICEEVLHRTEALKAAAEKVDGLNQQELKPVTRDLIKKTFSLFYRNRPPEKAELDALEVFVKKLGIEPTNQWRGMLQIICEQPGWEAV
jgi:hypothetical protein